MDKLKRKIKELRPSTDTVIGRVTQKAGEGIRSAKDAVEELDRKKNTQQLTDSLPGTAQLELLSLHARQLALDKKLEKDRVRLMGYKCREATNEYRAKKDMEIHRAYFRSGGIRFHIVTLLDHIKLLDPEHDNVNTMIIHCYNSSIDWMLRDMDALREKYNALTHELEYAKEMFRDDAALKKSIGYTDCTEQLRNLKKSSGDELAMELPKLRAAVEANKEALESYIRRCENGLSYRPINNMELLVDLGELLSRENTEKLEKFAVADGWDPASYYAEVTQLGEELKTKILEKYQLQTKVETSRL